MGNVRLHAKCRLAADHKYYKLFVAHFQFGRIWEMTILLQRLSENLPVGSTWESLGLWLIWFIFSELWGFES